MKTQQEKAYEALASCYHTRNAKAKACRHRLTDGKCSAYECPYDAPAWMRTLNELCVD